VKNTQQITRAMKFVAAARLRLAHKTKEAAIAARPVRRELARMLRSICPASTSPHPLAVAPAEQRMLAIVLRESAGCRRVNRQYPAGKALDFFRANKARNFRLYPLGKKRSATR